MPKEYMSEYIFEKHLAKSTWMAYTAEIWYWSVHSIDTLPWCHGREVANASKGTQLTGHMTKPTWQMNFLTFVKYSSHSDSGRFQTASLIDDTEHTYFLN